MRSILPVLISFGVLAGCCAPGSPGTIPDAEPDASFVTSDLEIYMHCGEFGLDGLCRVSLDGSSHQPIFDHGYHIHDLSDDGTLFLLGDDDTNLFVARADGTDIRRIPQLDDRTGDASFSPDGATIAAVRHADFSLPQHKWVDDDAVYFIDVETLAVSTVPKAADRMVTNLSWTTSGKGVQLRMFSGPEQLVALADGQRAPIPLNPPALRSRPNRSRETFCAATGDQLIAADWKGDAGLVLEDTAGTVRDLVVVEGRERRGHDYQPTIDSYFLTPDCAYAVYWFDGSVWIAETATGKTGPIRQGREPFLAPTPPPPPDDIVTP